MAPTSICEEVFNVDCKAGDASRNSCPCSQSRLKRYIQHCEFELRSPSGFSRAATPSSQVRENLLLISQEPDITRQDLAARKRGDVDLAVKVGFMTDCSMLDYSANRLERGTIRTQWRDDEPFSGFIGRMFPYTSHSDLSHPEKPEYMDFKSCLKATKLVKVLAVEIRATDEIRDHLRFDDKTMVLEVFHHVGFLKEQLLRTKHLDNGSDVHRAIQQGALPRQLVLEILESLQGILFPLSDKKSRNLLRTFVDSGAFDSEIQRFEVGAYRHDHEVNPPFFYLANRLAILQNELQNPRPRGWVERQFERRSGARYVMMATMIGVLFAVLLGFLSLGVSSYQTYIAYQAWKHPVEPGQGNR